MMVLAKIEKWMLLTLYACLTPPLSAMFSPRVLIPLSCKTKKKEVQFSERRTYSGPLMPNFVLYSLLEGRLPLKCEVLAEDYDSVSESYLPPLSQNPCRYSCFP